MRPFADLRDPDVQREELSWAVLMLFSGYLYCRTFCVMDPSGVDGGDGGNRH